VSDRPLTGPVVGRRTAVLGLAATALLAGCDHGDDIGEPTASPSPSISSTSSSAPAQTPDEQLVDQVTTELDSALGVLVAVRRAPGLRDVVLPLLQAHRRHLEVLGGDPTAVHRAADAPSELTSGVGSERRLRAALVDAAGRAESGALAKLLASMSASVTQHLAALPGRA
jgi:hypothetical protein